MDRTAWVAVILCVVGLVLWEWWTISHAPQRTAPIAASAVSGSATPSNFPIATAAPLTSPLPATTASPTPAPTTPSFPLKTETLSNGDVELHFTNRGGGISEAILPRHKAEHDKLVVLNSPEHLPIGAMVDDPNAPALTQYELMREGDAVQLKQTTADGITVRKKFFFPTKEEKDNYLVELDVDVQNGGAKPYTNPGYFLAVGSASPIHPADDRVYTSRLIWYGAGGAKPIDVGWFGGSGGLFGLGQSAPHSFYLDNVKDAEWTAVSNQFFTTLIVPLSGKADKVWARRFDVDPTQKVYGIEGAMGMPGFQLAPGQTYTVRFEIYAGPKLYHRLSLLEHNEAEVMDFGKLKLVCQFLLNALNSLHHVLGTYGAAILALTTIIKLVLWPLQTKANRSMRKTAVLAPKMQELREKYKDDPTKMNQEVMKLYKQYGINPVGGCLPMLIQIPIFFGLFTMLRQAVELRNAHFLWIHDLSQPDTIGYLPALGWPINVLPIIMAVTQLWLMQMTPKTGDATQRRMMMFTPLIFVYFCYSFAAALALYYTAQNILSIVQFYHNRRQPMPTLEKVAPPGKPKRR